MTNTSTTPEWFCVLCGNTSLNPCNHSVYRFAWNSSIQPVDEYGRLFRDVVASQLEDQDGRDDATRATA